MVIPESKAIYCPDCGNDRIIGRYDSIAYICYCYICKLWFSLKEGMKK